MTAPAQSVSERKPSLLIVDDDALITDTLAYALGAEFEVHCCESRRHAIVLAHSPSMKIFVLSGQNDAVHARHARALGATEFVAKPCDPQSLRRILARSLEVRSAEASAAGVDALLGSSPALGKLRNQIAQFADSLFPVLIEGESGSGKELVAASLHRLSSRAGRPYFALNCAAIAPTLVEPTLFGYAKGAFTGATTGKSGYFEDAQEGTLFLDEIGELPLELQVKLLRVLENGEYQRVGETQTHVSRARVIAATNRDLRQEVKNNAFRADLYHRLSVFTLAVPPLREMNDDRLALLEHFRRLYAEQAGIQPFELDEKALERWRGYPFPGNVRELRNIVIRLGVKYAGQRLTLAELEPELDLESIQRDAIPVARDDDSMLDQALRHLQHGGPLDLDALLEAWERGYIEAALKLSGGNVSHAAKLLGINRTTLYSRMEERAAEPKLPAPFRLRPPRGRL
ncbi:MAG: sigma-54-dependent Fis family transcriptional regulator [Betaproteobacteria bacterium]|nr:sigma-54-dependent Fis family transcriptional regulator [Betaproteobacteria bacterium]